MDSTGTRGMFHEFYSNAYRFQNNALLCFVVFGILSTFCAATALKYQLFEVNSILIFLFIFLLVLMSGYLFASKLYPIVGGDGELTVFDKNIILKPGESRRFWKFPFSVHTIPLNGTCDVEFDIEDLEEFHDLGDVLPEFDKTALGIKSLHVTASITWSISKDANVRRKDSQDLMDFGNNVIMALERNSLPDTLCEPIKQMTEEIVFRICEDHVTISPAPRVFSDQVQRRVNGILKEECEKSASKLVDVQVAKLDIELHTCTLVRTPV